MLDMATSVFPSLCVENKILQHCPEYTVSLAHSPSLIEAGLDSSI